MRQISASTPRVANIQGQVPIALGGTGSSNSEDAALALSAVPVSSIAQKGGVARLEANLKASPSVLPTDVLDYATIDGPDDIYVNQSVQFIITNYDAKTAYTVSVSAGAVVRSGAVITYNAPSTPVIAELTINNRTVSFKVMTLAPKIPSIISPVQSASNLPSSVTLTGSAFTLPLGIPNHVSSDWEMATDLSFNDIVGSSYNDVASKTQWTQANLLANKTYYGRVRYKDGLYGTSDWSAPVTFRTRASFTAVGESAKFMHDTAVTRNTDSLFGRTMSLSYDGSRLVVGAYRSNDFGTNFGSMYVFRKTLTGWVREAILRASGGAQHNTVSGDQFGSAVKMNSAGDLIAVGAQRYELSSSGLTDSGAVYIFSRTGTSWTWLTTLFPSDPANNLLFGSSIAADPSMNRIVIGATGATVSSQSNAGAIYVFTRSGNVWTQEAKLVSTTPFASSGFGTKVKMSFDGNRIITGAANETVSGNLFSGASYVFVRNGTSWSQEARIQAQTQYQSQYFGQGVEIDKNGTYAFIGARNNNGVANSTGRVSVYKRSGATWSFLNQFASATGANSKNASFGIDLSLDSTSTRILVGAHQNTTGGVIEAGNAYIYTYVNEIATEVTELSASDKFGSDKFGESVEISPDGLTIAVAALYDDSPSQNNEGGVYIFQ